MMMAVILKLIMMIMIMVVITTTAIFTIKLFNIYYSFVYYLRNTLCTLNGFMSYSTRTAFYSKHIFPDSKVHGANVGPSWGRQDSGGPHVGHMNFAIRVAICLYNIKPNLNICLILDVWLFWLIKLTISLTVGSVPSSLSSRTRPAISPFCRRPGILMAKLRAVSPSCRATVKHKHWISIKPLFRSSGNICFNP